MPTYNRKLIKDLEAARRANPGWPLVLSEGDSWFSYANVVGELDRVGAGQRPWALLRLEKAGDEILTILSGKQRAQLRDYLERWPFDAMLLSAGGNDIIGPDLPPLLRPFQPGMEVQDLVAFSRFERRLRQIQDCLRELLDLIGDAGSPTQVFVNSYDYVVPSGIGAPLGLAGPWVLPALEARNIPPALHQPVVRLLMDAFAGAVDAVAAEPRGFARLVRVPTAGLLGPGDWKDEIHPNHSGAVKVAGAFATALATAGVV
jgi:lysophospholipase L1-like esterase